MSKRRTNQPGSTPVHLDLERRDISELTPDPNNANRHRALGMGLLETSIRRHRLGRSILLDRHGRIIAGNATHEVAGQVGVKDVLVVRTTGEQLVAVQRDDLDLDEPAARELALADNRVAEQNLDWDLDVLKLLQEEGAVDLASAGFEEAELARLLASAGTPNVSEDDVPDAATFAPRCKPGELWQLGRHRLLCGDATKAQDVVRLMDGASADLWLTDPPYNVAYTGKTKDALTIENDSMNDASFRSFLNAAFACAFDAIKPGAPFYIWHADSEGYNFRGAVFDLGQRVRQCLIWKKQTLVMGRQDYHWIHEPCLYGWKEGAAHHWYADRTQTTVLEFDRPAASPDHPTTKPVELFAYLITNSCRPKGVVLDTFCGSGTTLIAAEQLGRTCYGMELDPHYCDVILTRWEALTGQTAERVTGGTSSEKAPAV